MKTLENQIHDLNEKKVLPSTEAEMEIKSGGIIKPLKSLRPMKSMLRLKSLKPQRIEASILKRKRSL